MFHNSQPLALAFNDPANSWLQELISQSLWADAPNFAQVTRAELSWYVQIHDPIGSPELQYRQFS